MINIKITSKFVLSFQFSKIVMFSNNKNPDWPSWASITCNKPHTGCFISPVAGCTEWAHQNQRRGQLGRGSAACLPQCVNRFAVPPYLDRSPDHPIGLHIITGYSVISAVALCCSFTWPKSGRKFYFIHADTPPNSHKGNMERTASLCTILSAFDAIRWRPVHMSSLHLFIELWLLSLPKR